MPTFIFTDPEGRKYEVTGPEGATQEQAFQILQQQLAGISATPATPAAPGAFQRSLGRVREDIIEPTVAQAASVVEPAYRYISGARGLLGGLFGEEPGASPLQRGYQAVRETAREAPAPFAGQMAGEMAALGLPAARAYQAGQMLTRGPQMLRSAAPLAAESAVVGAAQGLPQPAPGQTRLGEAAKGAALNLGLGAAMGGVSRVIAPRMFGTREGIPEEEAFLRAQGIEDPTFPLNVRGEPQGIVSRWLEWAHGEPLRTFPITASVLREQTQETMDNWREAVLRSALPRRAWDEVPTPRELSGSNRTRNSIGAMQDWYRQQYREVLDPHTFNFMEPRAAAQLDATMQAIPVESARRKVTEGVGDILQGYAGEGGRMTGSDVSSIRQAIHDAIRETDSGEVKRGYYAVLRTFDDAVQRQIAQANPEHAVRYAELAEPYGRLKVIENVSIRGPAAKESGEFTPNDLVMGAIGEAKKKRKAPQAARGQAVLQTEAERAAGLYGRALSHDKESLFRAAALGGMLGGTTLVAPGLGTVATVGTFGSVPRWSQRYLTGQLPWQQEIARQLRQPGPRAAASAARAGLTSTILE